MLLSLLSCTNWTPIIYRGGLTTKEPGSYKSSIRFPGRQQAEGTIADLDPGIDHKNDIPQKSQTVSSALLLKRQLIIVTHALCGAKLFHWTLVPVPCTPLAQLPRAHGGIWYTLQLPYLHEVDIDICDGPELPAAQPERNCKISIVTDKSEHTGKDAKDTSLTSIPIALHNLVGGGSGRGMIWREVESTWYWWSDLGETGITSSDPDGRVRMNVVWLQPD
ncbi:hypothetical protein BDZ91DRAFT_763277 [Kalaharituber pfeilii]|nr:hypothetical protein BDZ91DRAFT_763277 [Kalaharituber pfeilii]